MRRESDIQASLGHVYDQVPTIVAYCGDESVIGSEFYVMERLVGTILRRDIPASLGLSRDGVNLLCRNALDTLVDLHRVDVAAAGLDGLGKGHGYVERQVKGWSARYRKARTPNVGSFEPVMEWLEANRPEDVGQVLIHNDFRFDNLVLAEDDPTRIVGVLDWEMATVGDPLMDLGGAMAYWVQASDDPVAKALRLQPTHTPGHADARRGGPLLLRPHGHPDGRRAVGVLRGVRAVPARRHRAADLPAHLSRRDDEPAGQADALVRALPRPALPRAPAPAPRATRRAGRR